VGEGATYAGAGVDIAAGDAAVERLRGMVPGIGGFGGQFPLDLGRFPHPVLVASTDGVGTKMVIARDTGRYGTVGIDLVAMCVNDLVVQGAEPLFFLDYYATGKLDVAAGKAIIAGIAQACREVGCALVGGETAEMPGMYSHGDYDLAGFSVGAVERDQVIDGTKVADGDVILGLASTGLHSNGFSLVRKVVSDAQLDYAQAAPFATDLSLGEALLTPTRLYVTSCLAAVRAGGIKAFAHITGGGLLENIPRVLPDTLQAELDVASWSLPPVFRWLADTAGIAAPEMARTFNCGIGMIAVVAAADADRLIALFADKGETVSRIGRIGPRPASQPGCVIPKLGTAAWPA